MTFKFRFIPAVFLIASAVQAAPVLWTSNETPTPTPLAPPVIEEVKQPDEYLTQTPTPVLAPHIDVATPTPTPLPGLKPKNPTQAAIFSAILPGSGQVYDEDPLRGVAFAALFGVGLWQTLDNFSLHPESPGSTSTVAKNEDLGNLFGLATLAVYGFGVMDAYNGAVGYNNRNHLSLSLGLRPIPNASLAFRF
jgi:hypothetical protein